MNSITNPLRLAVGSHEAGSGRGCAMNVISWENGDTEITDFPACADPMLARVAQQINDTICTHRAEGPLLCADCSVRVLDLAHRTVGTTLDMPDADRIHVYARLALEQAESVAQDDEDERVTETRRVTAAWLDGRATRSEVAVAAAASAAAYTAAALSNAVAASTAAYAAASTAAYAAAASAAADVAASAAASAAADAANAATRPGNATGGDDRLARAHKLIDRFEALTGVKAIPVAPETVEAAIAQMVRTA